MRGCGRRGAPDLGRPCRRDGERSRNPRLRPRAVVSHYMHHVRSDDAVFRTYADRITRVLKSRSEFHLFMERHDMGMAIRNDLKKVLLSLGNAPEKAASDVDNEQELKMLGSACTGPL
jgi:hypothetical protein